MTDGILRNWPRPPATSRERLAHVLDAFGPWPDDTVMIQVTTGVYGPGMVSGLTLGDLRTMSRIMAVPQDTDPAATQAIPLNAAAEERA